VLLLTTVVGWPDVALALIAGLPGIIAAVYGGMNRRSLRTPSGKSIGRQVEDVNHTTIATHHNLASLSAAQTRRAGEDG